MIHEITSEWKNGMQFNADVNNHTVSMDAEAKFGGKDAGPRPKTLLLASLAGCTGMDVVSLLKKMRVEVDDFRIKVSGELTDEHPKYYHKIHVAYSFEGSDLDQAKLEKAVKLSQEKYCGVSAMLGKVADLTYEITYRDVMADNLN
jgi:putative redox protein